MTTTQLRYRTRRRAELRTFTVEGITRWLRRNDLPHSVITLASGTRRVVVALPKLPVDRLALERYGFSYAAKEHVYYRNATDEVTR